ncbi:MAG: ferrochelatase [Gammaproteobacteria bacterium]|nr:ferrochelatase [Gammaproteobacteria bacterium]MCI0591278.1 ferrochelatase [Gammaproteobacteria bacterium]
MTQFVGDSDFTHGTQGCVGILLNNLGTPDAPTEAALRRYLGEFLSDPRVIELPGPLRWLILHGVILRTRPRRSAEAYRKIWTDSGSPLRTISQRQANALRQAVQKKFDGPFKVVLGMRYGNPSIHNALEELRQANARRLLIFPLYPQYSAATTASTFDAVASVLKTWRWLPDIRMITHYHDDEGYINAVARRIEIFWDVHGRSERLLFSFHGIPKRYFLAGDPYHCQCHKTARLVAERLQLADDTWYVAFQSRLGPREWLRPYTDETLREWGASDVKSVDIVCPGFAADCLETLEEIEIKDRKLFAHAGGKKFNYIPALNDTPEHIGALTDLIMRHTQGWPGAAADWDAEHENVQNRASRERAHALGAEH